MDTKRQDSMAGMLVLAGVLIALAPAVLPSTTAAAIQARTAGMAEDADDDGIPDLFDLCPGEANVGQPDRDGDGSKDHCDLAPDGDGRMHVVFAGRIWHMGGTQDN